MRVSMKNGRQHALNKNVRANKTDKSASHAAPICEAQNVHVTRILFSLDTLLIISQRIYAVRPCAYFATRAWGWLGLVWRVYSLLLL